MIAIGQAPPHVRSENINMVKGGEQMVNRIFGGKRVDDADVVRVRFYGDAVSSVDVFADILVDGGIDGGYSVHNGVLIGRTTDLSEIAKFLRIRSRIPKFCTFGMLRALLLESS